MKNYRTIDLSEWHKTGEGNNSDSYMCDDDNLMLKVFKKDANEEKALNDYSMAQKVASLGIKTAAVYEIVIANGKYGVIYQNIKNKKSYSRLITDEPEKIRDYAVRFAKKAKELHSKPCDANLFESRAECIRKGINNAKFIGKYKDKLYKLVDELEGCTMCLHGDMQTGNLINADGEDYWIDFDRFSYGDPIMDIAHMYNMYSCMAYKKLIQDLTHMTEEQLYQFWDYFLEEYYGYTREDAKKFCESLDIYNALDLLQNNYRRPGIFADLITLILVKPKLKKLWK